MAGVVLDGVSRIYPGGVAAVSRLSLSIGDGELLVVVGPSGCGKTTLLRLVAGLEPVDAGSISIGGVVVDRVPPAGRDVAMVFQGDALYPHLSAQDNTRYGLSVRRLPEEDIERRVGVMARLLRLRSFLSRKPPDLSAGQRQRVAIARAVVRTPEVLLMDEPLTHVDPAERIRLRTDLVRWLRGLGATIICVTHDQAQAMAIGDRVAVMRAGRIEQVAEPMVLYRRPANAFVASFIGEPAMTLLGGWVEADAGRLWVVLGNQRLPLPPSLPGGPSGPLADLAGSPVTVGIRPEHVTDASTVAHPAALLFCDAARVEHVGPHVLVGCAVRTVAVSVADADGTQTEQVGGATLVARFPAGHAVRAGDRVELAVDMAELSYFDPVTGAAIWNPP